MDMMNVTQVVAETECWRCSHRVGLSPACGSCRAPQPLSDGTDHFGILGIGRSLVVDRDDLDRRYHDAARLVHPDRHHAGEARALELSVAASAAVNRAHRTLRDPVARGRYWLELHGMPLAQDNNRVPPVLAELVFDTQETLEELRAAPGRPAVRAAAEQACATVRTQVEAHVTALEERYRVWGEAATPDVLDELKERLAAIAYLRTLLADVEAALGD